LILITAAVWGMVGGRTESVGFVAAKRVVQLTKNA
jgi:hypothetical protein